jgi:hypothetical protein
VLGPDRDGGHVGEGAEEVALGVRERPARPDDAQLTERAVGSTEGMRRPRAAVVTRDQRAVRIARVDGRAIGMIQRDARAVVGGCDPAGSRGAGPFRGFAEARDRPVGAEEVPGVPRDRVPRDP